MSEKVFFVFAVCSTNIKSRHVDYVFEKISVAAGLREVIVNTINDREVLENNEEYSPSVFVRLTLVDHQPVQIEYNYSCFKLFEDIISHDFVLQHNSLLHNGRLIKIERVKRKQSDEETRNEDKIFTMYTIKEGSSQQKKKKTHKNSLFCSRTNALLSNFIQQCQLINPCHKLLPYVEAWQKNRPVNVAGFTVEDTESTNVRLSCCFNHVVVNINLVTHACKIGVLFHNCRFSKNTNLRFLIQQEVQKWYGQNQKL